jgi:hypothetical protein
MTIAGMSGGLNEPPCLAAASAFEDFLPLSVLHARVDAIVEGHTPGDCFAARRAIVDRVAANRRLAEALGWTGQASRRRGGSRGASGRRQYRGRPPAERRSIGGDTTPMRLAPLVAGPAADLPNVGWAPGRYRALEAAVRGRVVVYCPTLSGRLVDRLAARLARAALKYAAGR